MTNKIEIPEEIKIRLQEKFIREHLRLSDAERFLYDLIQKQDNEIGVGDFYYYMHEDDFNVSDCENTEQARIFNDDPLYKKVPKELAKQLEKLRKGEGC